MAHVWREVARVLPGDPPRLPKVKAHRAEEDVAADQVYYVRGNKLADHHAGLAARAHGSSINVSDECMAIPK
eukprot:2714594-Pyramimonas_sp.AAC.1